MSATPDHAHSDSLTKYFVVFGGLGVATAVEALPLFQIVNLPAPFLIGLSAVKFVVVVLIFMHMLGDHPMFARVFFIPMGMVILTVSILMALFGTWTLTYQENGRGRDLDTMVACYRANYEGPCASWVKSSLTGNEYCSAPTGADNACQPMKTADYTIKAYEALQAPKAQDPRMAEFDSKDPEAQKAVLMEVGQTVYQINCLACHGPEGKGGVIAPPLEADPVANGPAAGHISVVLKGLQGKVINGVSYASAMPAWPQLSNDEIAAAITFERASWGNKGDMVKPADIAAAR